MVADGNSLPQLAQLWIVEPVAELGLAHENDLQQLSVVGFEIGKKADLLEQFISQILRFVDDQDCVLAALDLLQKEMVDDGESVEAIQSINGQAILESDGFDQLFGTHDRVQNERGGILAFKRFEHGAAKGGFAGPHFAGQLDEAFSFANAVKQVIQRLAMFGAIKQEPRIWCNVKRRFGQAVVFQVHADVGAERVPRRGRLEIEDENEEEDERREDFLPGAFVSQRETL